MRKTKKSQPDRKPRPNPLSEAQQLQKDIQTCEKTYREALYALLGRGHGIAQRFRLDEEAWSAFTKDPFWNGLGRNPKPSDREQA